MCQRNFRISFINKNYSYFCIVQKATSAKGKAAEKSPEDEVAPTVSNDPATISSLIQSQGDRVRQLKTEKADKVILSHFILLIFFLKTS